MSASLSTEVAKSEEPHAPAYATDASEGSAACGPTDVDVSGDGLTAEDLRRVADLPILDKDGKSQSFKTLVQAPGVPQHLVILIRHWFCRICQEYVLRMTESMPPSSLPSNTHVTIIGCGSPKLIESYAKNVNCPFPLYTDPTGKIYKALGMAKTLAGGKAPGYVRESTVTSVFKSIAFGLSMGRGMFSNGDIDQVGGEMLFRVGPAEGEDGWTCEFIHRMRTTRDHMEVPELMKLIGMSEEHSPGYRGADDGTPVT